jgi:pimeloyl-ACP methyl ester carboxylesterase
MATFILIPGGWQGAWAYEQVASLLLARGHHALPLTLAGLGDAPAPAANLATHIGEVVAAIRAQPGEVVVAAHSYGGMVMTGAADAEPGRIRALVYSDAYVPESGDSTWSLTSPYFRDVFIAGAAADGLTCKPPANFDPRGRPHPLGAFLQAIELRGRWRDVPRKTFLGAHGWAGSPFLDLYHRLKADPAWTTHAFDCGHNIPRLKPEAFVEILLAQAA